MELELNKKEIHCIIIALNWYDDYIEEDNEEEIQRVFILKEKLKEAYSQF